MPMPPSSPAVKNSVRNILATADDAVDDLFLYARQVGAESSSAGQIVAAAAAMTAVLVLVGTMRRDELLVGPDADVLIVQLAEAIADYLEAAEAESSVGDDQ